MRNLAAIFISVVLIGFFIQAQNLANSKDYTDRNVYVGRYGDSIILYTSGRAEYKNKKKFFSTNSQGIWAKKGDSIELKFNVIKETDFRIALSSPQSWFDRDFKILTKVEDDSTLSCYEYEYKLQKKYGFSVLDTTFKMNVLHTTDTLDKINNDSYGEFIPWSMPGSGFILYYDVLKKNPELIYDNYDSITFYQYPGSQPARIVSPVDYSSMHIYIMEKSKNYYLVNITYLDSFVRQYFVKINRETDSIRYPTFLDLLKLTKSPAI